MQTHFPWPKVLNFVLAALLICLGGTVIYGWHSHQPALVQIFPNYVPMQYNTALGFLLFGFGVLVSPFFNRVAALLGALVFLIGLLNLSQSILQIDLGINQLLFHHYLSVQTTRPGGMAPNTALCFVLIGLMLVLKAFWRKNPLAADLVLIIPLVVSLLGFFAIMGYLAPLSRAFGWGAFTEMALLTAFGFSLVFIPTLPQLWLKAKKSFRENTYFLPLMAFLVGTTIFIVFWQSFVSREQIVIRNRVESEALFVGEKMSDVIKQNVDAMERLFIREEQEMYKDVRADKNDLDQYFKKMPAILFAKLHAGEIVKSKPVNTIGKIVESDLELGCGKNLEKKNTGTGQGRTIIGIYDKNLCIKDKLAGNLIVLDIRELFAPFVSTESLRKYSIDLVDAEEKRAPALSSSWNQSKFRSSLELGFNLSGNKWLLVMSSNENIYQGANSWLSSFLLIIGISFSLLAALVLSLWQNSRAMGGVLRTALLDKQKSEEVMRCVVTSSPGAILIVNGNDEIVFANPRSCALWGASEAILVKQPFDSLLAAPFREAQRAIRQSYFHNPESGLKESKGELSILSLDLKETPVELELSPIKIQGTDQMLCTFIDISQRKENESVIHKYMDTLKRSNEELDNFSYIASHDLKEPLRGISNFTTFLIEDYYDKIDDKGKDQLLTLQKLSKRMATLIDTLLKYSKVGSLDLKLQPSNVRSLIEEKLELLGPFLKEKNAEVIFRNEIPVMVCDSARIGEVFQNLITNAAKYNSNDRKIIEIGFKEEPNEYVFSIKDNGIGIAENNYANIFKIFKRLHGRNEFGGGTGAGMTIAKKIIQRHAGRIWLDSQLGVGTTFFFTISKTLEPYDADSPNLGVEEH
jgi:PAS domain S-box-containing protein